MSEKIFREKSLKRISSPEELNDYVKVANPGIWLIMLGVIVLLVGALIWSVTGQIDSYVDSLGVVENSQMTVYLKEDYISKIDTDSIVKVDKKEYKVVNISKEPIKVDSNFSEYMLHLGNLNINDWVFEIKVDTDLKDGLYTVGVVTESIQPITLLFE